MRLRVFVTLTVVLGVLAAGCTGPQDEQTAPTDVQGGPGQGGGRVEDVPPTMPAFTGSLATADNSGASVEVFTGEVFDANGEQDLRNAELKIEVSGPATATFRRTVKADEANALRAEPATFDASGWKVWSGDREDGVLFFKFRYAIALGAAPGTYTFAPSVTPAGGSPVQGPTDTTLVELFSEIEIDPVPANPDGTPATGSRWGGWTARPGATNVESVNFVRLENTGQTPAAVVVIDYTEGAFTSTSGNATIPIDGNIQFAWWEGSANAIPSVGNYTWLPASADGSVTMSFTGLAKVVFVKYRIVQLPNVLPAEDYGATYTATEL